MERTANPKLESSTASSLSPWLVTIATELHAKEAKRIGACDLPLGRLEILNSQTSVWGKLAWGKGALGLRLAYSPVGVRVIKQPGDGEVCGGYRLAAPCGEIMLDISRPLPKIPLIRWKLTLTPSSKLIFPFWPRDLIPLRADGEPLETQGIIFARQRAPKTAMIYGKIVKPRCGTFLYVQDLTSLNDYCDQAKVRPYGCVGGAWPELGFSLPPGKAPLKKGKPVVISDAILIISEEDPQDHQEAASVFLQLMSEVYLQLQRPATRYHDWLTRARESIRDLDKDPGCTTERRGLRYFNAYYGSGHRPPESMVQLAVLVPLVDYAKIRREQVPLIDQIKANIPSFYSPKLATMVRYLPGDDFGSAKEEQESHDAMDSWYLYHTLQNLGRLAATGDEDAKRLFLKSVGYGIEVGKKFKYHWPIFYDLNTKEPIKPVTHTGYGETDVAGLYTSVMLQAFDMTGDKQYLEEAKRAARTLSEYGFQLAYQFNSTIYAASALAKLWRITGDDLYRRISLVCIANVIANVWLWECTYGHGSAYPHFFGLPPLQDNEYIAIFEEMESLAAMSTYLQTMGDKDAVPLKLLLSEYSKYLLHRSWYAYPRELPRKAIAEKAKDGRLNRKAMIPLEDMGDGWYQHGQVGQEVYGAGAAPLYASFAYHEVRAGGFSLFSEYLVGDLKCDGNHRRGSVGMQIHGDPRLQAFVRLIPNNGRLPRIECRQGRGVGESVEGRKDGRDMEYTVRGGSRVTISWRR